MPIEDSRRDITVPLPYMLTRRELVIDPAAYGSAMQDQLDYIQENISQPSIIERLMRSTTLLFHSPMNNGTFAECLHTAIIWEVG